jgi:neutral ceramidase
MTPQIMPLQIIKIGSVALIAVPAEVTTMSGRRFRQAVLNELAPLGVRYGVISSLANSYASYLATREEYAKQWYEGAATLFGPHEQAAFQQEFVKLSRAIVQNAEVPAGPTPDDITGKSVDLTAKVVLDDKPLNKKFGSVITQPSASYNRGDTVSVQFWGAHPNNNYRTQDSFLIVEKLVGDVYLPVRYDFDPDTTYRWERSGIANSKVTITWHTESAEPGTYRIRHQGDQKSGWTGRITPYEGVSESFVLN